MVTVKRRASAQMLTQFAELSHLAPRQLELLAEASTVEELAAGRLLFKPGVREHQKLYLLSGEIALIADNQAVGSVVAGTDPARQALAPERPRELWGWTKSKSQVICIDAQQIERLLTTARSPTPAPSVPNAESNQAEAADHLAELRRALQQTEQERRDAQAELHALRGDVATLQQELTQTRDRLQQSEQALAAALAQTQAQSARSEPRPPAPGQAAMDDDTDVCAADDFAAASRPVPSLRVDPNERASLAATEIDDLLGSKPLEVPMDRRCRSGHR